MSVTIAQLADQLHLSRETVRQQVKKLPPEMVIHGARRTIIISDEAADIIRDALAGTCSNFAGDCQCLQDNVASEESVDNTSKNEHPFMCDTCKLLAITNEKLELLQVNLEDLREQLQVKNAEIERIANEKQTELAVKDQQIKDLMQALQNQQILQGKMMQLEAPKQRKWYDVFRRNKNTEQQ